MDIKQTVSDLFHPDHCSLQAFRVLKSGYIDELVELIRMPAKFPVVMACDHAERGDWAYAVVQVYITEVVTQESVLSLLLSQCALGLTELILEGDTQHIDPFLSSIDGLKKLSVWPAVFLISRRVEIQALDYESAYKVRFAISAG